MILGVPREIKSAENRVSLTPDAVVNLVAHGHSVLVEEGAGRGAGIADESYGAAGAKLVREAATVFEEAEMIVKVKEPQPGECRMLREGQILFTYLHLAPDPDQASMLLDSGCIAIACETVTDSRGTLPLLTPMSEVAGRMAIQAGAHCLERAAGGSGVLLGGVPGTRPASVVVVGCGVAGSHAIDVAIGMGARVQAFDVSLPVLRSLADRWGPRVETTFSTKSALEDSIAEADLVVGAVLVPGAEAPKVISQKNHFSNEGRERDGRYLDRPGWLRGDESTDESRRSNLRRERRGSLLRCEYSWCSAPHVDIRSHERDCPVRVRSREQGSSVSAEGRCESPSWYECLSRDSHTPGRSR